MEQIELPETQNRDYDVNKVVVILKEKIGQKETEQFTRRLLQYAKDGKPFLLIASTVHNSYMIEIG